MVDLEGDEDIIPVEATAGINSEGLMIELFDRSKIIQLVIRRWEGQFGPDG